MIKKEKQHAIVTLLITGLTFGILCLAAWFHTPNQISVSERRRLAQLPTLTKDSVGKGNFMSGFERYSQDQFPFREAFRKLKTKALFSLYQQKDVHGIYVADGYAASIESEINEASVSHAVNAFEHVYTQYLKNGSHEIYAAIVPDKGYYLAAKNGYPVMDYDKFFKYFENGMPYAKFIDLTQTLSLEAYYFTDSHWRQEALIETANQIKKNMKNDTLSDGYDICQAADSFYGVYSGQAALQVTPDKIMYIDSEIISQAQVYNYETKKTGAVYKVNGIRTVEYKKSLKKTTSIAIPSVVNIKGVKYQVTSIAPKAFMNNKKLKKVVIPATIRSIGKKAFAGCKNLKKIAVKTPYLTKKSVGAKAFKGIHAKAAIKVPKKKKKAYTSLFKAKGVGKKVKIK